MFRLRGPCVSVCPSMRTRKVGRVCSTFAISASRPKLCGLMVDLFVSKKIFCFSSIFSLVTTMCSYFFGQPSLCAGQGSFGLLSVAAVRILEAVLVLGLVRAPVAAVGDAIAIGVAPAAHVRRRKLQRGLGALLRHLQVFAGAKVIAFGQLALGEDDVAVGQRQLTRRAAQGASPLLARLGCLGTHLSDSVAELGARAPAEDAGEARGQADRGAPAADHGDSTGAARSRAGVVARP